MDMSSIIQLGAQMFQGQLDSDRDGQLEITEIASALMGLMSGNQGSASGGLGSLAGLTSLVTGAQNSGDSGLMSMVNSWIGTGANQAASTDQIGQLLGSDKVAAFAQQLGISQDQALKGLQQALPNMVDKATPTGSLDVGSLLDSVGGVSGAIGLASKIFGR